MRVHKYYGFVCFGSIGLSGELIKTVVQCFLLCLIKINNLFWSSYLHTFYHSYCIIVCPPPSLVCMHFTVPSAVYQKSKEFFNISICVSQIAPQLIEFTNGILAMMKFGIYTATVLLHLCEPWRLLCKCKYLMYYYRACDKKNNIQLSDSRYSGCLCTRHHMCEF